MKERLDILLVKRNLAPSREKAKAVIMSGIVYVDGQKEDKAGSVFEETVQIEVRGNTLPYVSRGGLKLEKAFKVSAKPIKPILNVPCFKTFLNLSVGFNLSESIHTPCCNRNGKLYDLLLHCISNLSNN